MEIIENSFYESIEKVLETMFFELPEMVEEIDDEAIDELNNHVSYHVKISFSGEVKGITEYYITRNLAEEFVTNFLGNSEETVPDTTIEDNLKEFANMSCGNFLSNVFADKECKISFPTVEKENFNLNRVNNWKIFQFDNYYLFTRIMLNT